MLKKRLSEIAKRICASIFLSAAVLSIANVDSLWHERSSPDLLREETQSRLRVRLEKATAKTPAAAVDPTPMERLRFTLTQDELGGEVSPFGELANIDPLTRLMNKGITGFQRQAYRSPQYKAEVGYDLVQYEIEHPDKAKSYILAYLEHPLGEGNPDALVPVVIVMQAHEGAAKQSFYRGGALVEQGDLSLSQVQSLMAQKLNAGIPFFSVSR